MILLYTLEGHTPRACTNPRAWAKWSVSTDRQVAKDIRGDVTVSTIFLGRDYNFPDGPHAFFETLVFGGALDQASRHYETWEEAERGHQEMLGRVSANG